MLSYQLRMFRKLFQSGTNQEFGAKERKRIQYIYFRYWPYRELYEQKTQANLWYFDPQLAKCKCQMFCEIGASSSRGTCICPRRVRRANSGWRDPRASNRTSSTRGNIVVVNSRSCKSVIPYHQYDSFIQVFSPFSTFTNQECID